MCFNGLPGGAADEELQAWEAGLEPDGVVDAADEELQADAVVAADAEVVPPAAPPPLPPPPCAPPPAHSNLLLPSAIPWAGVIDSQTGL